jgi:hypothetical protein
VYVSTNLHPTLNPSCLPLACPPPPSHTQCPQHAACGAFRDVPNTLRPLSNPSCLPLASPPPPSSYPPPLPNRRTVPTTHGLWSYRVWPMMSCWTHAGRQLLGLCRTGWMQHTDQGCCHTYQPQALRALTSPDKAIRPDQSRLFQAGHTLGGSCWDTGWTLHTDQGWEAAAWALQHSVLDATPKKGRPISAAAQFGQCLSLCANDSEAINGIQPWVPFGKLAVYSWGPCITNLPPLQLQLLDFWGAPG